MDFLTTEVWTARGLVTHYVLFVIEHATRVVETRPSHASVRWVPAAGITTSPDGAFMAQVARNLTAEGDGFLAGKRYLVLDRDTKFTADFCRILKNAGVEVVRTAFQAPNMNAFAERWVRSVKSECLDKMILFGQGHLERALGEFVDHFHVERPHQGVGNELVRPASDEDAPGTGDVVVRERLGGLLHSYERVAA